MSDSIKVTVRVRPFIKREVGGGDAAPVSHWEIKEDCGLVQVNPTSRKSISPTYMFDGVFGPEATNEDVYNKVAMPIVESALSGFNGTIFVYGQTSSGKTFTMMGDRNSPGIVPLTVQNIFRFIEDTPDREYLIRASYMEIYNENISDLLGRDSKGRSLNIREDMSGTVYVGDLKEECANCEQQLLAIIKRGEKNRQTASTNMNEHSSRSHTIFRLILESRERGDEEQEEGAVTVSHLNLVDLAGSENASQSGATGDRLREGGFINKSLFMLGRVISQLSEGEPYVNFRDSKLTRILQPSLGGNSKTSVICTVTPATVDQTHSTLRFAGRAKAIKNKPIVNEVVSDAALLKRYAREIKALQHTLALERNTDKNQEVEQVREMFVEQAKRNEELEAKVTELQTKLVVSSLPRGRPTLSLDKKKKARRETWCGPAVRNSRFSVGNLLLPTFPSIQEHEFVQPKLPPWTETSICSEGAVSDTSSLNLDNSITQEEFGKYDASFIFNQAEMIKSEKPDFLLQISPCLVNTDRRKKRKVKFDVAPSPPTLPPTVSEIGCQTEESLLPQMRLLAQSLPSTPKSSPSCTKLLATPSTPTHVLRARNKVLKEELRDKEEWLNNWRQEMENLREFQHLEIKSLEESFEMKVATLKDNHHHLEEPSVQEVDHLKEIASLKKSLQDYEQLLMDANREMSHNVKKSAELQSGLETLTEENIVLSAVQDEAVTLKDENKMLKKDLEVKDCQLKQCQNERSDFDMRMELALEKQRQKQEYLQKNLEEAWKEIGAYEKGDVEEVKQRHQRVAELEEMMRVSATTTAQCVTESSEDLEYRLVEVQEEADELKGDLLEVSQQVEKVTTENEQLKQEVKDLQEHLSEVLSEQGSDRIHSLKEEVDDLREKLEKAEEIQQQKVEQEEDSHSPLEVKSELREGLEGNTLSSQDFSRALSETIQALEESICLASTPGRQSFVSCLDALSHSDLEASMPLIETLKAGLTTLQKHIQVMEQQQEEAAYVTENCLQITSEIEKEWNTWKNQESFIGDYILHTKSLWEPEHHNIHTSAIPSHTTTQEAMPTAIEEIHSRLKAEYETKMKQYLATLESRSRFNSSKTDTLFFSFSQENDTPTSMAGQSEKCEDTMLDGSFLNLTSQSPGTEMEELKRQLELLTQENNELLDQVMALQKAAKERDTRTLPDTYNSEDEFDEPVRVKESGTPKEKVLSLTMPHEELEDVQEPRSPAPQEKSTSGSLLMVEHEVENATSPLSKSPSAAPQSLADELRQAGMNFTMLNETFETSVLMPMNVTNATGSDILELRQRLCVLEQENAQLQDNLKQTKEKLSCINEKSIEEKIAYIAQLESEVQKLKKEWQTQTSFVKKLQDELNCKNSTGDKMEVLDSSDIILEEKKLRSEVKVNELEEKLRYQNVTEKEKEEEEDNSVSWQIKKLEEEKLDLEAKLSNLQEKLSCMNLMEEEVHCLHWQVTTLKEAKSDLEKELVFMQDEVDKLTRQNEERSSKPLCEDLVQDGVLNSEENKESIVSLSPSHYDTDCEDANNMQQKAKELEEAKEEIRILKQELQKTHRISEEICAERNDEDETSKEEQMELRESKEKIECLKQEIGKFNVKYEEELAEKESELEMIITNFTVKEECFEETEEELKRVITELKDLKEMLAKKDLELQGLQNKYNDQLDSVTLELEEMKVVVFNKDQELQSLKDKDKNEYMQVTSELQEMKKALINKDIELQSVTSELERMKEADNMANNNAFSDLEESLQKLKQDYADLQIQSEKELVEVQQNLRKLEKKYDNCFQDYTAATQASEGNRLMFVKSEEEKEILKEKHESQEKEILKLKHDLELQSELEKNLKLEYENELQKSEEEKENVIIKYECEIQKHEDEKENLKLKYESEILNATAVRESQSREALGFSVQSDVEQKLDEMETLKDNLEEKVKECDNLRDTVQNLKTVLTKKQEELHTLSAQHQDELAFYIDNLNEKEKKLKDFENEVKRRSEEVVSLTSTLSAKDHRLHRLERDLNNAQEQLKDKETELQDGMDRLRRDYEEVCTDRSRMCQELQTMEEAKETVTHECSQLKAQLDNVEEDLLQVKEELEFGKNEIVLKQEIICTLEAQHQQLKEELESVRAKETELLHQQVASSHEVERLIKNVENHECEMLEKKRQILAMSKDLVSKTESSEKLVKDLQQVHSQLNDKCREQEEAERRCEVMKVELEKYKGQAERIKELMTKLSAAEGKILTLEAYKPEKEMTQQENQPMMSVCEDCSNYKSLVARMKTCMDEKETEHENRVAELSVHLSTSQNTPYSFNTSMNSSNLRTKSKKAQPEKKMELLNRNYDLNENEELRKLEVEYNNLQEKYNAIEQKNSSLQEKYNAIEQKNSSLQEEFTTLQEKLNQAEADDFAERSAAAERENNELKLRLMAMDAPSKKKLESLKEELRVAKREIFRLKGELRRQQEIGRGDSTMYELTGQSSAWQEEGKTKSEPDYSSGSTVVNQLVVMELQNKLYHLEKDKKMVENEVKVMQQHLDHYQNKAREWKVKAVKEEQLGKKNREKLDQVYTELKKYIAKTEELNTKLEKQQFELGHQRELNEKMKGSQDGINQVFSARFTPHHLPSHSTTEVAQITPASRESAALAGAGIVTPALTTITGRIRQELTTPAAAPPPPGLGTGSEGSLRTESSGEANSILDQEKQKQEEKQSSGKLGVHNPPLSYRTRVEKLPFMKDVQAKAAKDEVPMWRSQKENDDITKYKLPPEARKRSSEDCKTQ